MVKYLEKYETALKILALVALFLLVSSLDYQDEQTQQRLFCENVRDGIWPEYKQVDCKDGEK